MKGAVYWVDLTPHVGAEAGKVRPAVIVGVAGVIRAAIKRGYGVVTVVPLTKNTEHVWPFQAVLPATITGLPHDSKAQAEQLRAVDVGRLRDQIGMVPAEHMGAVDEAVLVHLGLD
ncbi:type II toxin-antitoxin system PemK/MazF family toxin [Cellulomonas sp. JH27-2]|uniref:type II toxin-antitoxin system PemK/MazF family toxin n=1 Tax=Cellulomonas sp. JH27-2 TaxID=2774139 RepID=UPI00177DF4FC|nr:type II toxin-antitoxin system PemK/MazF family toxin [Cellulomonas sp. JH27-2]